MLQRASDRIANKLIASGTIVQEDKEIYTYGLHQGMSMLINVVTTVIIGILLNMMWSSVVFMLSYIPIRSYAGGYHARTPMRCQIMSIILVVVILLSIKMLHWTDLACLIIMLLSGSIIALLAPVESKNKPLSQKERKVFKKRTLIILGIIIIVFVLFVLLEISQISVSITLAVLFLSIMLIAGKMFPDGATQ